MPEISDATLEDLLSKPRRRKVVPIHIPDPDNATKSRQVNITIQALGSEEYDDLVAKHPPTKEQEDDGASWDSDTFVPALLAASLVSPVLSVEQARELKSSKDWAGGEMVGLFDMCLNLNMRRISTSFTDAG